MGGQGLEHGHAQTGPHQGHRAGRGIGFDQGGLLGGAERALQSVPQPVGVAHGDEAALAQCV